MGVVKNFAIFAGKHLRRSLFLTTLQAFFREHNSTGCYCCFKKLVNSTGKQKWRRLNRFIKQLVDILHIYIPWVIFQQLSRKASGFPCCVCVKRITLCNCLCSSPSSSHDFASVIRNIGKFGAKNYFTDHQEPDAIYYFWYLPLPVPVLKIYDRYSDTQKFGQNPLTIQAIASYKARTDVNNLLQTVLKHFRLCILTQIVW